MPQLLNTLACEEQAFRTPSRQDGVPVELEDELRAWGCQLIQLAGVLLDVPQVTMATAQVLFQRFWFVSSFAHFDLLDVAMGATFLAGKLEETPKRIRDVVNVFDFLVQRARHEAGRWRADVENGTRKTCLRRGQLRHARRSLKNGYVDETHSSSSSSAGHRPFQYRAMSYFSNEFYDTKDALIVAEMQILKRLGFNVQVNLPYATMVNYLQLLNLASSKRDGDDAVAQHAWSILNDALQTTVYVLFPCHVLAAAAIYLTSLTLPSCPVLPLEPKPWWELFDVTREDLRLVSSHILRLYSVEEEPATTTAAANTEGSKGLAARLRHEHGGLVDFTSRLAVRDWLSMYGEEGSKYVRKR